VIQELVFVRTCRFKSCSGHSETKTLRKEGFLLQYVIATELMSCPPAEVPKYFIGTQAGSGHKSDARPQGRAFAFDLV